VLVPIYAHEDGSIDIAVVDVTENDLGNLSQAWDEEVGRD